MILVLLQYPRPFQSCHAMPIVDDDIDFEVASGDDGGDDGGDDSGDDGGDGGGDGGDDVEAGPEQHLRPTQLWWPRLSSANRPIANTFFSNGARGEGGHSQPKRGSSLSVIGAA